MSLESIQATGRLLPGIRLGSTPGGPGRPAEGAGPTAAPAADETEPGIATPVLRLGAIGYFRHQKFVEVIYTPILPAGTGAELFADVEAQLVVHGVDAGSLSAGAARPAPADRNFEDAYRAAFINYEQGRGFRTGRRISPAGPGTGEPAGAASLSGAPALMASPFIGATTPVYRVVVTSTGIHRLTQPYLIAPGTGTAPGLVGADPRTFKLLGGGVEVPIRVTGEADGSFDPADFIEFFGEGLVGEPDILLNTSAASIGQPGFPDIFQINDVTDENVYFLFAEPGPRARVPDLAGPVNVAMPQATSFDETLRREFDTIFVPLGKGDPFFMKPALRPNNGTVTPDPGQPNCGYSVNPGIHNLSQSAKWLGPGFTADPNSAHHCPSCELNLPDVLALADPA
ncbi:MAG TPA: hypothetical protein VFO95_06160, partial [Gemmatimonadales bacterium]|nr:hypothetical protein [Gemmatimonadales bacterium]